MVTTSRLADERASAALPKPPAEQLGQGTPRAGLEARSASCTAALVGGCGPVGMDGGLAALRRSVRPSADPPQGTARHNPPRAPRVHAVQMAVAPPPSAEEFAAMMETDIHDLFDLPAIPGLVPPLLQSQGYPCGLWTGIHSVSTSGSVASAGP